MIWQQLQGGGRLDLSDQDRERLLAILALLVTKHDSGELDELTQEDKDFIAELGVALEPA